MLILSRKLHEGVTVDGPCRIVVMRLSNGKVRLGIDAAPHVNITRAEKLEGRDGPRSLPSKSGTDEPEFIPPMEPIDAPAPTNGTSPPRNPGSPPTGAPIHRSKRHRLRP